MQDYFCPQCGRRLPNGHCKYCKDGARRAVRKRPDTNARSKPSGEKIIPFDSIKNRRDKNKKRGASAENNKVRVIYELIYLDGGQTARKKNDVPDRTKSSSAANGKKKRRKKGLSRWLTKKTNSLKRLISELVFPEE